MKTSSVLIRPWLPVFALVLVVPILTSPMARAFGGGNGSPFSNGTFFTNEGTFQTTIRGVNLSGVATFSTGAAAAAADSSGSFTVSYQGFSYTGNVDGSIDAAGGTIAAALEASVARGGSGTATSTLSMTPSSTSIINLPDEVTQVQEIDAAGNITTTTTTVSGLTETVRVPGVSEISTSRYQDTLYTSGSFTAKLKNSYPNQIFKGKGTMEFTAINFDLTPPALGTTTVSISVKGVRLADTTQTFTDKTVQAPFVLTTTTLQTN